MSTTFGSKDRTAPFPHSACQVPVCTLEQSTFQISILEPAPFNLNIYTTPVSSSFNIWLSCAPFILIFKTPAEFPLLCFLLATFGVLFKDGHGVYVRAINHNVTRHIFSNLFKILFSFLPPSPNFITRQVFILFPSLCESIFSQILNYQL